MLTSDRNLGNTIIPFSAFMTKAVAALSLVAIFTYSAFAQPDGKALFKQNCLQCHSTGDNKVIGPGLKDIMSRVPDKEWLVKWVQNSPKLIKSGDKYAVQIYEANNKTEMPPQPVSVEDIDAILTYIDDENAKKPEQVQGPGAAGEESSDDSTTIMILLGLGFLFILLIGVLRGVKKSLNNLVRDKEGLPPALDLSMTESVLAWMRGNKRVVALIVIVLLGWSSKAGWDGLMEVGVEQGYEPEQPIAFSHKIHAGENGIDCQYCHFGASKGKTAGIPSANVCMNCHRGITKGSRTGTEEISKIYAALDYDPDKAEYGPNPKPVKWIRVHNLPDFAYFNHSQHVVVGGVECQTCHGPVEEMEVMRQESPLTMAWCVNCHRQTEVKMEGNAYYDEIHAKLSEQHEGDKFTVDKIGGTDCVRCHY